MYVILAGLVIQFGLFCGQGAGKRRLRSHDRTMAVAARATAGMQALGCVLSAQFEPALGLSGSFGLPELAPFDKSGSEAAKWDMAARDGGVVMFPPAGPAPLTESSPRLRWIKTSLARERLRSPDFEQQRPIYLVPDWPCPSPDHLECGFDLVRHRDREHWLDFRDYPDLSAAQRHAGSLLAVEVVRLQYRGVWYSPVAVAEGPHVRIAQFRVIPAQIVLE